MLRKPNLLAAVSLVCAFLAPIAHPASERFALAQSSTSQSTDARELQSRVKLAEAAQKQDLDALRALLENAEKNADSSELKLYALAYYGATLDATDKSRDALKAFAERFRAEAAERSGAAACAPNVCRSLARYDAELAKELYYKIVDDCARSLVPERRFFASELAERGTRVRPYAPSDANVDEALLEIPDDLEGIDAVALKIRLQLAQNAFLNVNPSPGGSADLFSDAYRKASVLALDAGELNLKGAADVANLAHRLSGSKSIQKLAEKIKKLAPELYQRSEISLIDNLVDARINEFRYYNQPYDDVDGAAQAFAKYCVETIAGSEHKDKIVAHIVEKFCRADDYRLIRPEFHAAFDDAVKNSDVDAVKKYADALDGLARFRALVGETPVLEGICDDGAEFSFDDYRGKATLVVLRPRSTNNEPDQDAIAALKKFDGKFAVVEFVPKQVDRYGRTLLQKRPWRMISQERSNADASFGGKKFVDLDSYYGSSLGALPNQRFLIAPDGKVAAVSSTKEFDLDGELKKIFNEE